MTQEIRQDMQILRLKKSASEMKREAEAEANRAFVWNLNEMKYDKKWKQKKQCETRKETIVGKSRVDSRRSITDSQNNIVADGP